MELGGLRLLVPVWVAMDTGVSTDVVKLDMFWATAELVFCMSDGEPGEDIAEIVADLLSEFMAVLPSLEFLATFDVCDVPNVTLMLSV